ncbi:MAG: hypothetical protein ACXV2D_04395, partial [Halobacteriota archaeon]
MINHEEKGGVSAKTPQVNSLTDTQYGAQGHNSCCFRGGDDHTDRHDLRAEIRKGLHAFYTDGDAIELRILDGSKVGSCYYTSFEALINDVLRLERSKKHKTYNYFTTINEIDRDATLRRNTLKWGREAQPTTADSDIAARRGFFIDCDPSRKSGISASEDEKNSAWTLCSVVDEYLVSKGLPHGAICDSGNGFHLRHITDGSIGVDAESTTLLADFLEAIDAARKVDGVTIDKTVVNPARICKLYGTEARKGVSDPATTRVHRYSRVLSVPAEPVTRAMIERVVNEYRAAKPTKDTPSTGSFDMRGWLDSHNIAVARVKAMPDGGTKYILETCPFNPDHTNGSAFVIVKPNGARIAGCRHNSCSGNDWYTLRNMYDDDYVRVQSTTARQDYIKEWYDSPKTYRTNESIAKLFYQVFDGAIVFSHELNEWLLYNGKYWEIDTRHHVYNMLIDLLYDVVDVIDKAKPLESDEEGLKRWKEQKSWVVRQKNRRPLDDTLHIAQKKMARPLSDFDAHDTYLNVLNGTVDLVSGEIRNHTPTDYLTRICDVEFHPSAAFERWDSLLLESLGREEYVRYLQREMGYAINGISNEELLIMLYGEASTGKSTFYESVMGVLGTNGDGYGAYVG